ncbi:rhodanese-like domain-containing protein, partial [Agrobacterium fabrum]
MRQHLLARSEILLADVREEDPFAQGHPLWAANFPIARLELDAWRRIPQRDTLIVLYGHDGIRDLAPIAVEKLKSLGYTNVHILEGGLEAWKADGGELFIDVNVPSKSFGELVEAKRHTPLWDATKVKALLDEGANAVVFDARRFDEYQTMSIPKGINVPGGELVLRARDLAPDPETLVIVNCAGRTRSIIGTQSLINAGIPNKVVGLRNGTIGWTLAGQTL